MKQIMKRYPLAFKLAAALAGVILLQVALAFTYLSAFNNVSPNSIPVAVISDDSASKEAFRTKTEGSFFVHDFANKDDAEKSLKKGDIYGIYEIKPLGSALDIATALDKKVADATKAGVSKFDQEYQKEVVKSISAQKPGASANEISVNDALPLDSSDVSGVSIFYTAFSFVFGGYLAAVAVGTIRKSNSGPTRRRVFVRVAGLFAFSVAGSLLVSVAAAGVVSVIPAGSFMAVWGIGILVTWGVSLLASALISVLGTVGTGLVVFLFVILGTPASGGPVPLLFMESQPWGWLSVILPTGQAMDAVRAAVYLDGYRVGLYLLTFVVYVIIGIGALAVSGLRHRSFDAIE